MEQYDAEAEQARGASVGYSRAETEAGSKLPSLSKAKLEALIEEAVVDAYGDEEQTGGFFTMIEEHLALPFSVSILGVDTVVEKVDMTRDCRIVAVCKRVESSSGLKSSIFRCPSQHLQARNDCGIQPLAQRVLSERIPVFTTSK